MEITRKYLDIIGILNRKLDYISKIKVNSNLPGFLDLLHFSIADYECEIFLTTDKAFKFINI